MASRSRLPRRTLSLQESFRKADPTPVLVTGVGAFAAFFTWENVMLERIFAVMLIGAVLPCFAQHGPIGRAIKSTQVTADPSEMEYTTNTVVQEILEDISDQFGVVDATFMKGTNIKDAVYNADTLTWGGLMKGTNIEDAVYNPTNLTWEGLVAGARLNFTTNIAGIWYRINDINPTKYTYLYGGVDNVVLPDMVDTYRQLKPGPNSYDWNFEIEAPSDAEGWWGDDYAIHIPVTGLYYLQVWTTAKRCGATFTYQSSRSPNNYSTIGTGIYGGTIDGGTVNYGLQLINHSSIHAFTAGDSLTFWYKADQAGSAVPGAVTNIGQPSILMYLLGP